MRKNVVILKEEPKTRNARLSIVQKARDVMVHDDLSCSENGVDDIQFNEDQEHDRASSPLDTIADVACRLGAEIPVTAKRTANENVLPENAYGQVSRRVGQGSGSSQSPASIPTGETGNALLAEVREKVDEITGDTNVSLRSLLRLLHHFKLDGHNAMCVKGQWNGEVDVMDGRAMIGKLCEEFHDFKHAIENKLGEQVRAMRQMEEEIVSLRSTVAMLQGNASDKQRGLRTRDLNGEEYGRGENVISFRAEDGGKVCFIMRTIQDCNEDGESNDGEEVILSGNELRIGVGGSRLGKRAVSSEDMMSIGSEGNSGADKRVRRMEMRSDGRAVMTRGESVTGTESMCNSDKRSRGKGGKGKTGKRRRDNWTEDENNEFMSIVIENQDIEEMSLRRMLARRFSPRRTHEQCANHLRILRAQKKLPAAREAAEEKKTSQ